MLRLSVRVKVKVHFKVTWFIKHMKIAHSCHISRMGWAKNFKLGIYMCTYEDDSDLISTLDLDLWPWLKTHKNSSCNISTVWAIFFRHGKCIPKQVFPDFKLIFVSLRVRVKGQFKVAWFIKHMKIAHSRHISRMVWANNFKLGKCIPMEMTVICGLNPWPWPLTSSD